MIHKFNTTQTSVMFAALTHAEEQGADLCAILERDFGQAPKRPKRWLQKTRLYKDVERLARLMADRGVTVEYIESLLDGVQAKDPQSQAS